MYEAIGVLEIASIASGVEVADAMAKVAPVDFVDTVMVTPGKYVVVVHGDPSSVDSSVSRGREVAGDELLDWLLIPFIHPQVYAAIRTTTVATGVVAADRAAKAAAVQLVQLHLARGIGGKSILTLTGPLHEVEAAVEAGKQEAQDSGKLVATRVIPNPHPDLAARLMQRAHGVPSE
jgi:microcompartment protein CcmL/EutN